MGRKIVILGTGGTIAGTGPVGGNSYTAAQLSAEQLVGSIPALMQAAGGELQVEEVARIDSKDMTHAVWQQLAQRCLAHLADDTVGGIVITHGTDTLEETAWLLHEVLPADKPVVLACAMRPATALCPDGPQNLLDAVDVAAHPQACGVLAVVAGSIHGAREVAKVHPQRLDAFASLDGGPLGWVQAGDVRWAHAAPPRPAAPRHGELLLAPAFMAPEWPRVEIVLSHAGSDGMLIDALVAGGVHGIVVAATGNGTLHERLQAALRRAIAAGVAVRIASRCGEGCISPITDQAWKDAGGLSPVKARIRLMLELMQP
ncbi:MAG: L-asparaginase [Comamonas sp. SCN 65-56]|uniref:asparaginase n=1 Tax=Comamonas sp. SCN 65-56 TaxID=1660095 RepID=UPI00086EC04C|nr:asparaginase [Comamonas sp. SCN 65-56]ODS91654.1 MAG: L-asparaginase [Comamonas sp. SCN 65-56]